MNERIINDLLAGIRKAAWEDIVRQIGRGPRNRVQWVVIFGQVILPVNRLNIKARLARRGDGEED